MPTPLGKRWPSDARRPRTVFSISRRRPTKWERALKSDPIPLCLLALHRHRAAEPGAGDFRQKFGVARVRLVVLKLHHRMGPAGVDQLHRHMKDVTLAPNAEESEPAASPLDEDEMKV